MTLCQPLLPSLRFIRAARLRSRAHAHAGIFNGAVFGKPFYPARRVALASVATRLIALQVEPSPRCRLPFSSRMRAPPHISCGFAPGNSLPRGRCAFCARFLVSLLLLLHFHFARGFSVLAGSLTSSSTRIRLLFLSPPCASSHVVALEETIMAIGCLVPIPDC